MLEELLRNAVKRTTSKKLGIAATQRGLTSAVISTDEMGLEEPTEFNFRAGSLSAMDVPAAVLSAIKYVEETKKPDIIFIEGQSSLTEKEEILIQEVYLQLF